MCLLHCPLHTRRIGIAHHRALQTSWRGWADSKAVHGMECIGGALTLLEVPLSRGCCLKCTVLPVLGGVLTYDRMLSELWNQEPNKTRTPRPRALVVYIADDALHHQPMGAGHMTVLVMQAYWIRILPWCYI